MQVQLKQTEIVSALKQYLVTQGINLNGKSVNISFTAGRKESGISADISIDDTDGQIPGFTDAAGDDEQTATKPVLSVVKAEEPAPEAKAEEPAADAAEPVKATTSLFG